MNPSPETREPLAVEMLIGEDARREGVTVAAQEAFRKSIATQSPAPFDEIDELVEELRSMTYEEEGAAR
jgi:hypothetical protein